MLISGIFKRCATEVTQREIWSVIIFSLATLLDGRWPECDWNGDDWADPSMAAKAGTWLAGGLFGVVWCIKADKDWVANGLGLEHYGARLLCPWCQANRSQGEEWYAAHGFADAPWADISADAVWRRSRTMS